MSVPKYHFKCLRCMECCIKTVADTPLGKKGVFLLPNETHLFPNGTVKPSFGIGLKGKARPRPEYTISYQMIKSPCPHLDVQNAVCRIYPQRPNTCKSFPLEGSFEGLILHHECKGVYEALPHNVPLRLRDIEGLQNEFQHVQVISQYFALVYMANILNTDLRYGWYYQFEKQKWFQFTTEQLTQLVKDYRKQLRKT